MASVAPSGGRPALASGYLLASALAAACVASFALRLHAEARLAVVVSAVRSGDLWSAANELSTGRLSRAHRAWRVWVGEEVLDAAEPALVLTPPPGVAILEDEGALLEAAPIADPYLLDPGRVLDRFFVHLAALERGERPKARVVYFGTSEIGHDRVTSQMRRMLQERFGDGGKGFVLIDRTWAILDHRDVVWRHDEPNWKSFSIRTGTQGHGHYGLGGVLVKSVGPAWAEYETVTDSGHDDGYYPFVSGSAWSRVELHYQAHPRGAPVTVRLDGQPPVTLSTRSATLRDERFVAQVPDGPHRLRVHTKAAGAHLYGVILERAQGLVLDALPVIGAFGGSLANFDPEHLRGQLAHRDPSLLIFQLGAKESLQHAELSDTQIRAFTREYAGSVRRVLDAAPDRPCLVISPKDQGWQVGGRVETRPAIPRLVGAAETVARETGCAFYNLFEAMGGAGTARRWFHQRPRLVSADLGHLEAPGSQRVGTMLGKLLLDAYAAYRGDRGPLLAEERTAR